MYKWRLDYNLTVCKNKRWHNLIKICRKMGYDRLRNYANRHNVQQRITGDARIDYMLLVSAIADHYGITPDWTLHDPSLTLDDNLGGL